jgi:protein-disulfide isomerase
MSRNRFAAVLVFCAIAAIGTAGDEPPAQTNQFGLAAFAPGAEYWELGPRNAAITMIEFSDFECPYCSKEIVPLRSILSEYRGKIHLIFKHTPLPFHTHALLAHEASMAAAAQHRFWEMHDLLFANQKHLERADLSRYASQLGLDMDAFNSALDQRKYRPVVERLMWEALGFGVNGTPTIFVNGKKLDGDQSVAQLRAAVEKELSQGTSSQ